MLTQEKLIERTQIYRHIPVHTYAGYPGPWLENVYFDHFIKKRPQSKLLYIPIFWTDLWCHLLQVQNSRNIPELLRQVEEFRIFITTLFDEMQESGQNYYTIIQHDHGRVMYEFKFMGVKMPDCLLVYTQSGVGEVTLPLLKDMSLLKRPVCRDKKHLISFCGNTSTDMELGIRSKMDTVCRESFKDRYVNYCGDQWISIMADSTFSLCPRGCANTSFRIYEALQLVSIPVYIYTGTPTLPYQDLVPWERFSIIVNSEEIDKIPEIVRTLSQEQIDYMLATIEVIRNFFTYSFACSYIDRTNTRVVKIG